MNIKAMIAAAAVGVSTLASATTFQYMVNPNYNFGFTLGNSVVFRVGAAYENGDAAGEWVIKNSPWVKPGEKTTYTLTDSAIAGNTDARKGYRFRFGLLNDDNTSTWALSKEEILAGNTIGGTWKYGDTEYKGFWNMLDEVTKSGVDFKWDFKDKNGNTFVTFSAQGVPEPTSGLLLLLGAGMLALRRKTVRA